MKQLVFIAAGGALGALLRYAVSMLLAARPGHWPLSTLAVNIAGSLVIGGVYVLIAERAVLHPDWRSVLMVGLLGALTTFSTFSLETVLLLESGYRMTALAYTAASVLVCVGATALGMYLTRLLY